MKGSTRAFYRRFKRRSDHPRVKVSARDRSPAKSAGKRSGEVLIGELNPVFPAAGIRRKTYMAYAYVYAMYTHMCMLCIRIYNKEVKRYNENGNW